MTHKENLDKLAELEASLEELTAQVNTLVKRGDVETSQYKAELSLTHRVLTEKLENTDRIIGNLVDSLQQQLTELRDVHSEDSRALTEQLRSYSDDLGKLTISVATIKKIIPRLWGKLEPISRKYLSHDEFEDYKDQMRELSPTQRWQSSVDDDLRQLRELFVTVSANMVDPTEFTRLKTVVASLKGERTGAIKAHTTWLKLISVAIGGGGVATLLASFLLGWEKVKAFLATIWSLPK